MINEEHIRRARERKNFNKQQSNILNQKYSILKDLQNGIEPEPLTYNDTKQILSNENNRDNTNKINNAFQNKVYKLFNNDGNDSNNFMSNFDTNNIQLFNSVYPELLKLYQGTFTDPMIVLNTANQLIDNLLNTGTIIGNNNNQVLQEINNIKNYVNKEKLLSAPETNDINDLLDAIIFYDENLDSLKNTSKWLSLKKKIVPDLDLLLSEMASDVPKEIKVKQMLEIMKRIKTIMLTVSQNEAPNVVADNKLKIKNNKIYGNILKEYQIFLDYNKDKSHTTKKYIKNNKEYLDKLDELKPPDYIDKKEN